MASEPTQAQIDLTDKTYGDALVRALGNSPLLRSASLGSTRETGLLRADAGEAPVQDAGNAEARFIRRLFGHEPDSGWEAEVIPGPVQALTLCRQTILFQESENLLIRRCADHADRALLISVSNTLSASAAQALSMRLATGAGRNDLEALLAGAGDVMAGATVQLADGELLQTYRRADDASKVKMNAALGRVLAASLEGSLQPGGKSLLAVAGACMERVTALDIESDGRLQSYALVPMVPDVVLGLQSAGGIDLDILRKVQREATNDALRRAIETLLEDGLTTQVAPFPSNEAEFQTIVGDLRKLPEDDLITRLDIGGFAAHGFGTGEDFQQCKECIYYLPHRKWCDIPELPLPVEPHWWCRLWKM